MQCNYRPVSFGTRLSDYIRETRMKQTVAPLSDEQKEILSNIENDGRDDGSLHFGLKYNVEKGKPEEWTGEVYLELGKKRYIVCEDSEVGGSNYTTYSKVFNKCITPDFAAKVYAAYAKADQE